MGLNQLVRMKRKWMKSVYGCVYLLVCLVYEIELTEKCKCTINNTGNQEQSIFISSIHIFQDKAWMQTYLHRYTEHIKYEIWVTMTCCIPHILPSIEALFRCQTYSVFLKHSSKTRCMRILVFQIQVQFQCYFLKQGAVSIKKTVLPGMAIPMLKIRRPNGRLIFNMEITIRR